MRCNVAERRADRSVSSSKPGMAELLSMLSPLPPLGIISCLSSVVVEEKVVDDGAEQGPEKEGER